VRYPWCISPIARFKVLIILCRGMTPPWIYPFVRVLHVGCGIGMRYWYWVQTCLGKAWKDPASYISFFLGDLKSMLYCKAFQSSHLIHHEQRGSKDQLIWYSRASSIIFEQSILLWYHSSVLYKYKTISNQRVISDNCNVARMDDEW
jgi:hypothetical protein